MTATDALFETFQIKSLTTENRIVMAPMTRNQSPDQTPNDITTEYYRRRAAGEAGLIITEGAIVNHIAASAFPDVPYFYGEKRLEAWKKVVDAVHGEGGKIAPQLWHCGGVRKRGTPPEGDVDGYAPSGMNVPGRTNRHTMTRQDIQDVIRAFAEGARDAKRLGFDAIEIHGAHGYLLDQFFWEGTNQRDDEYGGSLENRGRFTAEIVEACRAEVGNDFPIILRWSQWKQQDYTARLVETPDDMEAFLKPLVDAGVDVFHCSQRRFWEPEFEDSDLNLAGWVKKLSGKPTITVGSVSLDTDFLPDPKDKLDRNPVLVEAKPASIDRLLEMLNRGDFDMVAVGRAMIANADWAKLIRGGDTSGLKAFDKQMLMSLD